MDTTTLENEQLGRYGAAVILKHADALQQEIDGVRLAEDIECIHRMRVASRRLRNALDLFMIIFPTKKHRLFVSQVRRITQALGAARDLDVQIDLLARKDGAATEIKNHAGLRRLLLRLRQNRIRKQASVLSALDRIEKKGAINQIREALQPFQNEVEEPAPAQPVYSLAGESILSRLDNFLSYELYIRSVECVKELHEMRIAAKKLRYTLETFAPLYVENLRVPLATARAVQEILGGIHDCDVWIQTLPEFIEAERGRSIEYSGSDRIMKLLLPGMHYFQRDRAGERDALYSQFLELWDQCKRDLIWENLSATVRKPMLTPAHVYPVPLFTISGSSE